MIKAAAYLRVSTAETKNAGGTTGHFPKWRSDQE